MIVPVVVLLVVIGGGVALAGAAGVDRRLVAVLAVVAVVALGVAATVGLSFRGEGSETKDRAPATPAAPTDDGASTVSDPVLRPFDLVLAGLGDPDRFAPAAPVLDQLPAVTTKFIALGVDAPAVLQQCVLDLNSTIGACGKATPTGYWFDDHAGLVELRRQLVTTDGSTVDCTVTRCAVIARAENEADITIVGGAALVFGRPAPKPTVRLANGGRMRAVGDEVTARLAGFVPGERVTVTWCTPPGPIDPAGCGAPAESTIVTTDDDGAASAVLAVPETVGERQASCGPRRPCAIAVRGATVPVAPAVVAFAGADGPDLPTGRVLGGVAAALLAGALALWLVRSREAVELDPFAGVSLDVPEWEGIDLGVATDEEAALTAPAEIRGS
jgi:hypothetical protein